MSIISEALRKAQERHNIFEKKEVSPNLVERLSDKDDKPKRRNYMAWVMLFSVLGTLILIFIAFRFAVEVAYNSMSNLVEKQTAKELSKATKPSPPPPAPVITIFPKVNPSSPQFTLNGIVFGDGNPYAVINDKILEVGDRIGEATVKGIESNKVTLLVNDKEVVLTLK